jgi:hypothetical protein
MCRWLFCKISYTTNLSIVGACRHTRDEPLVLYMILPATCDVRFIDATKRCIRHWFMPATCDVLFLDVAKMCIRR